MGEKCPEIELLVKAREGDKKAEEEFIEKNIGLVKMVVKKFSGRGYEIDDIYQLGMMGLYKAVTKFDFSYEVKFSTYAVPLILGEIKRFLRDDSYIKVSRSVKDLAIKLKNETERIEKATGKTPTISELSKILDVSKEDVVYALSVNDTPASLDATIGSEDDGMSIIEKAPNHHAKSEDTIINNLLLKEAIGTLKARERQIIVLRYFKGVTQQKIADMIGISQVQVSRIEKKVLKSIKEKLS